MGLSEQLKALVLDLKIQETEAVPTYERLAFRLMNEAESAQNVATGYEEKEAASRNLLHECISQAYWSFLDPDLNVGFFVFKDRSMVTFYGENNSSYATSSFNDKAKEMIDEWMHEQGIDFSHRW